MEFQSLNLRLKKHNHEIIMDLCKKDARSFNSLMNELVEKFIARRKKDVAENSYQNWKKELQE